ncbi:MAG TPA: phosphoribosylanthranilate isomerase [Oculatellaceae cyanobacterium]
MTNVKICGITNVDDAILANELGASFLGLIFVSSSPRSIEIEMAERIADRLRNQVRLVGVFQNSELGEVKSIAERLSLDYVQLHGFEGPEFCSEIERPVIKAFPMKFHSPEIEKQGRSRRYDDVALVAEIQRYPSNVQHFLFDKPKTADSDGWLENAMARLARIQSECRLPPYFFAGGLHSQNVRQVIDTLHPFAIDVASGVEAKPGIKDKRLMAEFMDACQNSAART